MKTERILPSLGVCLHCKGEFPFRKGKKYCSANCRKRHSEGSRASANSPRQRRINKELFDSQWRMAELYYKTIPADRPEFLLNLIELAIHGENKAKAVMTNWVFHRANPVEDSHMCYWGRPTLAQEANRMCKQALGVGVSTIVQRGEQALADLRDIPAEDLLEALQNCPLPQSGVVYVEDGKMGPLAFRAYSQMIESKGLRVEVKKASAHYKKGGLM